MKLSFKEWLKLQEVGTGTNAIAMFKRPVFGEPIRRQALGPWAETDPFFKKRHKANTNFDEHGGDPTAYGSTLGSDPDGQSLPSAPLKATSNMATTNGQPTLQMPINGMKKKSNKK